jgi:hypothetical protein
MKNIHILPTDKPSRLFYIKKILVLDRKKKIYSESYKNLHEYKNQNIYITSDEKIKEGNYTYHRVFGVGKITNVNGKKCFVTIKLSSTDGSITTPWKRNIPDIKKIILTTDPQLIADGVQAIDDEFLEWFVKNPSCEEVETYRSGNHYDGAMEFYHPLFYKIIIPKEEPKQETLEEASNRAYSCGLFSTKTAFIAGVKWQQERSYSEEEVIQTFHYAHQVGMNSILAIQSKHSPQPMPKPDLESLKKEWFEQFKKK